MANPVPAEWYDAQALAGIAVPTNAERGGVRLAI